MRPASSRRGSAAIEFSLWLPVLLLFVSAVVDWGMYMTTRVSVARATMDGTRGGAAVFEPSTVTPGSMVVPAAQNRASNVLSGMGMTCGAGCNITTTYCPKNAGGVCQSPPFNGVTVNIQYAYTPFFGFLAVPTVINERFIMAVESQR